MSVAIIIVFVINITVSQRCLPAAAFVTPGPDAIMLETEIFDILCSLMRGFYTNLGFVSPRVNPGSAMCKLEQVIKPCLCFPI